MIQWRLKTFEELTNKELYELMRLRQEVFIVEQNCPYLDADGKDLSHRNVYRAAARIRAVRHAAAFGARSAGRSGPDEAAGGRSA